MEDRAQVDILSRIDAAFRTYRVALELELRLLGLVPLDMAQELRVATDAAKRKWLDVEHATQQRREVAQQDSGLADFDRAQRHDAARA